MCMVQVRRESMSIIPVFIIFGMSVFLESVLPAFKWLTKGGFILGLVESFLYGVYTGIVFVPIYDFINRRLRVYQH